jgi:hypothetical protein
VKGDSTLRFYEVKVFEKLVTKLSPYSWSVRSSAVGEILGGLETNNRLSRFLGGVWDIPKGTTLYYQNKILFDGLI